MSEVIRITPAVAVPVAELEFRASRSSGPGGQGGNTTDSRAEARFHVGGPPPPPSRVALRFGVAGSPSLPPEGRERALRRLGPRLDSGGVLRVVAQAQRSQLANRRAATERF